jgi:hypothetical protein
MYIAGCIGDGVLVDKIGDVFYSIGIVRYPGNGYLLFQSTDQFSLGRVARWEQVLDGKIKILGYFDYSVKLDPLPPCFNIRDVHPRDPEVFGKSFLLDVLLCPSLPDQFSDCSVKGFFRTVQWISISYAKLSKNSKQT